MSGHGFLGKRIVSRAEYESALKRGRIMYETSPGRGDVWLDGAYYVDFGDRYERSDYCMCEACVARRQWAKG